MKERVIIWDFDGVIIDSNEVREAGFKFALSGFNDAMVDKLLEFHRENGGLSRYRKFDYFFKEVGELPQGKNVEHYLKKFGDFMQENLFNVKLLNLSVIDFIKSYQGKQFIASGSDQFELRQLCKYIEIDCLFQGIYGSPRGKNEIVSEIVSELHCGAENFVLVGDSLNDFEAAQGSGIDFIGFSKDFRIQSLSNVLISQL